MTDGQDIHSNFKKLCHYILPKMLLVLEVGMYSYYKQLQ